MDIILKINTQAHEEDKDLKRFCLDALQKMLDRMSVSHFKYGIMCNKYPHSSTGWENAKKRLELYSKTGNTEHCLDAANFLIIEYLFPSHIKQHFKAESSSESPGIIYNEDR